MGRQTAQPQTKPAPTYTQPGASSVPDAVLLVPLDHGRDVARVGQRQPPHGGQALSLERLRAAKAGAGLSESQLAPPRRSVLALQHHCWQRCGAAGGAAEGAKPQAQPQASPTAAAPQPLPSPSPTFFTQSLLLNNPYACSGAGAEAAEISAPDAACRARQQRQRLWHRLSSTQQQCPASKAQPQRAPFPPRGRCCGRGQGQLSNQGQGSRGQGWG